MTESNLKKLLAENYPSVKYDDILGGEEHFPPHGWEKYSTVAAAVIRGKPAVEDLKKKLDEAMSFDFIMFECGYVFID